MINDKRAILIEKIKHSVVEMIHYADELPRTKFSSYLSEKLGYNYNYLAAIFIEVQGITIQQYIILHKTERAKELILYDELTLNEIAEKLHYSSVAHFSAQFKKVTGVPPSFFKQIREKRKNLEDL